MKKQAGKSRLETSINNDSVKVSPYFSRVLFFKEYSDVPLKKHLQFKTTGPRENDTGSIKRR